MKKLLAAALLFVPLITSAKDSTIEQVISTYEANQARFHVQFRGKQLSGIGTVTSIRTDVLGTGKIFNVSIDLGGSKVSCLTQNANTAAAVVDAEPKL